MIAVGTSVERMDDTLLLKYKEMKQTRYVVRKRTLSHKQQKSPAKGVGTTGNSRSTITLLYKGGRCG